MKPCTHHNPASGRWAVSTFGYMPFVPMRGCRNFRPRKFQSVPTFNTL